MPPNAPAPHRQCTILTPDTIVSSYCTIYHSGPAAATSLLLALFRLPPQPTGHIYTCVVHAGASQTPCTCSSSTYNPKILLSSFSLQRRKSQKVTALREIGFGDGAREETAQLCNSSANTDAMDSPHAPLITDDPPLTMGKRKGRETKPGTFVLALTFASGLSSLLAGCT